MFTLIFSLCRWWRFFF